VLHLKSVPLHIFISSLSNLRQLVLLLCSIGRSRCAVVWSLVCDSYISGGCMWWNNIEHPIFRFYSELSVTKAGIFIPLSKSHAV